MTHQPLVPLIRFILFFNLVAVFSCQNPSDRTTVVQRDFGTTKSNEPVQLFRLTNANGMVVEIIEYGATVTSMYVPDRNGTIANVVFGHDNMQGYEEENDYFGCIVGRYANRVARGRFTLLGKEYQLALNNGPNTLHGGWKGFDKQIWKGSAFKMADTVGVLFTYLSPDGEEGYPGNLECWVRYSLNNKNELLIEYEAETDAPTVLNLCNHTYFNLKDAGRSSILDHTLQIFASGYTPVDSTLIPTGEITPVENTPFDFRNPVSIGARIDEDHQQLKFGRGYDHNYVLDGEGKELSLAARVTEPTTGRILEVYTTEPGMQFYSGNFLDGTLTGRDKTIYHHRSGFALETQHFPDSPNQPHFPTTVLNPGETFQSRTLIGLRTL